MWKIIYAFLAKAVHKTVANPANQKHLTLHISLFALLMQDHVESMGPEEGKRGEERYEGKQSHGHVGK